MVNYVREMMAKKPCKYGTYGLFAHLPFLLIVCKSFYWKKWTKLQVAPNFPVTYLSFDFFAFLHDIDFR